MTPLKARAILVPAGPQTPTPDGARASHRRPEKAGTTRSRQVSRHNPWTARTVPSGPSQGAPQPACSRAGGSRVTQRGLARSVTMLRGRCAVRCRIPQPLPHRKYPGRPGGHEGRSLLRQGPPAHCAAPATTGHPDLRSAKTRGPRHLRLT